jgi:hypothetical protein
MNASRWELLLWGLTCAVVASGIVLWPEATIYAARIPVGLTSPAHDANASPEPVRSPSVQRIVERNPFRFDRVASRVAYGALLQPTEATRATKVPRPNLLVVGIAGGSPWQAVIDGIPDRSRGVVARPGDSFGDLRIRMITRDSVVVLWRDTTWTLLVRGSRR